MAKNQEKRRARALELDPLAYRREAPKGSIEASDFCSLSFGQETMLVGRLMLADCTGQISRLGLFGTIAGISVLDLERIEGNGSSVPAFLRRDSESFSLVGTTIHYGDIVAVQGSRIDAGGYEAFLGSSICLLSKAVADVYDSNIDLRKWRNVTTFRHMQLMREQNKVLWFKKCSTAFRAIREFLYARGYDELNMTLIQESFEAGLADPFVTRAAGSDKDLYLRLTSEMMLRKLMVAGFSKVFEIGKSFRNQGATATTLPQFTILELYRAYAGREDMENLTRSMILDLLERVHGSQSIPVREGVIDCSGQWQVQSFPAEVERLTGSRYDESRPIEDLLALLDKAGIARPAKPNAYGVATALYGHIVSKTIHPTFLRDLPAAQSPLFKMNDDMSTVDETLLIINGMLVADIVNPERDPAVIRKRMEAQLAYRAGGGLVNEDAISAMRLGLPPCRGIGMGLERLLMLILNAEDIRDVDLFPVF